VERLEKRGRSSTCSSRSIQALFAIIRKAKLASNRKTNNYNTKSIHVDASNCVQRAHPSVQPLIKTAVTSAIRLAYNFCKYDAPHRACRWLENPGRVTDRAPLPIQHSSIACNEGVGERRTQQPAAPVPQDENSLPYLQRRFPSSKETGWIEAWRRKSTAKSRC